MLVALWACNWSFTLDVSQVSHVFRGWGRVVTFCIAVLASVASGQTFAQADPPGRAGRVVDVAGGVWFFELDTGQWVRATRNQTIGQGDRVRTDSGSRVHIRIGSSGISMDGNSDLLFAELDDARVELELGQGQLGLELRSPEAVNEYEVITREGRMLAQTAGVFQVQQLRQGTRLLVLRGQARFDSGSADSVQRAWLREGEQIEFWWADGPRMDHQNPVRDSFSEWVLARTSQGLEGYVAGQGYVSPELTGAEDLERYGRWEQSTEYGNVWTPHHVEVGWSPYTQGRWSWTVHWGWAWVDSAPWGFAPYHYGRWVQYRGRWCWAPGRYVTRPVYRPALIDWRDRPAGGVGPVRVRPPPPVKWVPLPPRQTYVPAYPHGRDYRGRIEVPRLVVVPAVIGNPQRPQERIPGWADTVRRERPQERPQERPPVGNSPRFPERNTERPSEPTVERPVDAPARVVPREREIDRTREQRWNSEPMPGQAPVQTRPPVMQVPVPPVQMQPQPQPIPSTVAQPAPREWGPRPVTVQEPMRPAQAALPTRDAPPERSTQRPAPRDMIYNPPAAVQAPPTMRPPVSADAGPARKRDEPNDAPKQNNSERRDKRERENER